MLKNSIIFAAITVFVLAQATSAQAATFEWVTVGDPGNVGDTAWDAGEGYDGGLGDVAVEYRIGKYEVTNDQYAEFLNAAAGAGDPNGLYNSEMGADPRGGITESGGVYTVKTNMGDKPVNYVSWADALRMSNWMHNGQGAGDTENGAYDMSQGVDAVRKPGARVWLGSLDEWWKAAFYDAAGSTYWDYATQSNTMPTPVTADASGAGDAGDAGNFANWAFTADWDGQDGHVTTVGTNGGPSPYGTHDQNGNVWELCEDGPLWNTDLRVTIGGSWDTEAGGAELRPHVEGSSPGFEDAGVGFRLAAIPGTLGLVWRTGAEDDWTSENWTQDNGTTHISPTGGEPMIVNSGIVTVSTDLTVFAPAESLSIALDAEGGTVEIASGGTLAVDEVSVAAGGTLNVSGTLNAGALTVAPRGALGLGDGGMVKSALAEDTSDATIAIDGALNAGDGVAMVGDEVNDLFSTNLTLADGSTFNWTFGSGNNYVDVFGEVIIAGALTIQLVDGGGVANNQDVALFRALDAGVLDPSSVTVLSPAGENWTWDTDGNGDPILTFVGGEFLVLEGLVTGAAAVPGDANGDRVVDGEDLALFEAQFGGTPGSADFDNDGDVDLEDFAVIRGNWGFGTGGAPLPGAATPEPASAALLVLGLGAVIRRRRR